MMDKNVTPNHCTCLVTRNVLETMHDKCMVISITLKQTPIHANYTLHGKQLTMVECAKYLGVSIDSKLSFNQHMDNVCKKASSVLSFVRRNQGRIQSLERGGGGTFLKNS